MQLITKELEKMFPALYETEDKSPEEVKVIAKFFNPTGPGTWFAVEYDPPGPNILWFCEFGGQ